MSKSTERGFSLLELLVALAVTASVVTLLFAGFGVIGRLEEKSAARAERSHRMLMVSQWLQKKFDALRILSRQDGQVLTLFFNGNAAGVMWVAPFPERGNSGGLHVMRLGPKRFAVGHTDLQFEAVHYDGALAQLNWGDAVSEALLKNVTKLQWYYWDGAANAWSQQWGAERGYFPSRLRVEISDEDGDWPPLYFSLPRAR